MLKPLLLPWRRRIGASALLHHHHLHCLRRHNLLTRNTLISHPSRCGFYDPFITRKACLHTNLGEEDQRKNYFSTDFWDETYAKNSDEIFEWYKSYSEISPILKKHVPLSSRVLIAGCGNSLLSEDMVKDGYEEIVNIDISPVVISSMQKKYENVPQLKYMTMNALDLSSFENHSFHSVIDKGTLDAIMSLAGGPYNVAMMLAEINRILKPSGVYVLVTFAGPQISLPLLNTKAFAWDVSLYITSECVSKNASDSSTKVCPEPVLLYSDGTFANNYVLEDPNPLFIYVCTKVSICVYLSFENKVDAFLYMFCFDQYLLVLCLFNDIPGIICNYTIETSF